MFVSQLLSNCSQFGNELSLFSKNGDNYTWTDYLMNVIKVASSLKYLGISSGDTIIIQGTNSPKWFWVAMASMYLKCILVPIPTKDLDVDHLKRIIKITKSFIIFSDNPLSWKFLKNKYIVQLLTKVEKQDSSLQNSKKLSSKFFKWEYFLNLGEDNYVKPERNHPTDICFKLIKESNWSHHSFELVSLSYSQLNSVVSTYQSNYGIKGGKMISYLPLTQINVLVFDFLYSLVTRTIIYFCNPLIQEQIPLLIKEIKSIQPIFFYSVPYIWNQLKNYYQEQIHKFQYYLSLGVLFQGIQFINRYFHSHFYEHENKTTFFFYILIGLYYVTKWITSYFKKEIGFQNCQVFTNIYEHLNSDTLYFFSGLDIPIFQVYGNLETAGLISLGNNFSINNVGFPIMQISITDENQILVKSDTIDPSLLDQHGWLYTQDCGKLLEQGQLQIFGPENKKGYQLTKIEFYFKNNINYLEDIYIQITNNENKYVNVYFLIQITNNHNLHQQLSNWVNRFNNCWKDFHYQINDFKIINIQDTLNDKCRDNLGKLKKDWYLQI